MKHVVSLTGNEIAKDRKLHKDKLHQIPVAWQLYSDLYLEICKFVFKRK